MRKKGIFLKNGIKLTLIGRAGGNIGSVKNNLSLIRMLKAADDTQRSRFAAAAGTKERQKFIFPYVQTHIVKNKRAVIGFCNML